jgi:hypothetical protein
MMTDEIEARQTWLDPPSLPEKQLACNEKEMRKLEGTGSKTIGKRNESILEEMDVDFGRVRNSKERQF